jgi:hypothetical protein
MVTEGQTDVSSVMHSSSTLNGALNKRTQWKSHVMMMMMPMRILTNFIEYYILVVTKTTKSLQYPAFGFCPRAVESRPHHTP